MAEVRSRSNVVKEAMSSSRLFGYLADRRANSAITSAKGDV